MKILEQMSEIELLQTHGAVIDELRRRGVAATRNNPIADYAEWLVCNRLKLEKAAKNQKGYDATDKNGKLYQNKGGRQQTGSVLFSPIRNLTAQDFDYLIAVAFKDDYSIRFAVKISHEVVSELARDTVNGPALRLSDDVVKRRDMTELRHLLA